MFSPRIYLFHRITVFFPFKTLKPNERWRHVLASLAAIEQVEQLQQTPTYTAKINSSASYYAEGPKKRSLDKDFFLNVQNLLRSRAQSIQHSAN